MTPETRPQRAFLLFYLRFVIFASIIRIFQTQTHTQLKKPRHPTPYGVFRNLMGVSSYLFGHGLVAAAPGHGQVALGTKKMARPGPGPDPDLGGPDPAPLSSPQPPLGHGLAPPPPGHGQISNWKRLVNFRKRHLGWGGVGPRRPEADIGVGWGGVRY